MAWGAAATGTRAATGSTGQGLSLMQESIAEIALARLPLVVLNMARAQGDYWQATRGGGHGDYRASVLAPMDVTEAVELAQLAFHLADRWRNPVLLFGDYYLAHTYQSVDVEPIDFGAAARQRLGARRRHRRHRRRPAGLAARHRPSSATASATTWPSTTSTGVAATEADARPGSSPVARDRHPRRRRGGGRRLRHPGQFVRYAVAAAARARASASATCGRSRCSRSRATASREAAAGAPRGRGVREQPGPDGRRRAARGARRVPRSTFIGGLIARRLRVRHRPRPRRGPAGRAHQRVLATARERGAA